ncbi:MAG: hypothetical protein HY858_11815 [Candidatus Solibacter usitatus]|nr:hypothetical protein [Candidatus Solibacter usitatus]
MTAQPDSQTILGQFNRLIEDLLSGQLQRTRFEPWEMAVLLDIEGASLAGAVRRRLILGYQHAVQRQFGSGAARPMTFSQYLCAIDGRRAQRKPPARAAIARASSKTGTV